jgi:hypothetical protein
VRIKFSWPYAAGDTVDYFFNHQMDFVDDEVFGTYLDIIAGPGRAVQVEMA